MLEENILILNDLIFCFIVKMENFDDDNLYGAEYDNDHSEQQCVNEMSLTPASKKVKLPKVSKKKSKASTTIKKLAPDGIEVSFKDLISPKQSG